MKKILIIVCLSIISSVIHAQTTSIGIKGGVNFATMTNSGNGAISNTGSITTFNAGAFVNVRFENVSLQTGLSYIGEGQTYILHTEIPVGANFEEPRDYNTREQLYYLQLPVNIIYHIPAAIGNFYFGAGPYIADGISGKIYYNSEFYADQKITFGNGESDIRPIQFGANAVIGFKFRNGILINTNYDLGLTNDMPSNSNGGSTKSRVFGISLGYMFL